jgi:hypothetical protein
VSARRGVHLVLWEHHTARDVMVPACRSCLFRQRTLRALLSWGPLAGLVVSIFLPLFTPLRGAPVMVLMGVLGVGLVYGLNRGRERADWLALGVRASLAADGATVYLRFRDAALEREVAGLSRGSQAPP